MHRFTKILLILIVVFFSGLPAVDADNGKKLRIYILAGQSNMVGTGAVSSFDYIGEDPAARTLLKQMVDQNGQPKTCDRVWISSLNGKYRTAGGEGTGKLSAGYGFRTNPTEKGDCIGPEYTFGLTMEQNYDGPILIIKTAWGGKSLFLEYRPPSAGPYVMPQAKADKLKARANGSYEKIQRENQEFEGKYYRSMIQHIRKVLKDIKRVCPDYDPSAGYEISGFVWFQGWNDYSALLDYPLSHGEQQYEPYSKLLSHLIRDVRRDLECPQLPFVVGVMGINGDHTPGCFSPPNSKSKMERFRKAMAAPANLPEFKGNVIAVPTAVFWDDKIAAIGQKQLKVKRMRSMIDKKSKDGPNADGKMSNAEKKQFLNQYTQELFSKEDLRVKDLAIGRGGFVHYYGSAKFHAQAGQAFAQALLERNP